MLVGFLILFKSADEFVIGPIASAKNMSVSPIIIGLMIVALGTSAPEIFVAITSSLQGETHLSVSNAIGSNITNIGTMRCITVLIIPLRFRIELLREDMPVLIFLTVFCRITFVD
jgi:cation:H+ antiporter